MIVCGLLAVAGACSDDAPTAPTSRAHRPVAEPTGPTVPVKMNITGMMCGDSCPPDVKQALARVPGVYHIKVDFETKSATMDIDAGKVDEKLLVAALRDSHYDGSIVK